MATQKRVVLISGASSGIGAATAQAFHRQGWMVYATARRIEALAALRAQGMHGLQLDVTDEQSMAAAVQQIGIVQAEEVAQVIVHAATVQRPWTRYKVGWSSHAYSLARRLLSDRAWDWLMERQFPFADGEQRPYLGDRG